MRLRVLLFIGLLAFIYGPVIYAQQGLSIIKGTVSDSTGAPLKLVNIVLEDNTAGTYTDDKGFFTLYLPGGKRELSLRVSSIGYYSREIELLLNSDTTNLDIVLKTDITALREVIVRQQGITESPTLARIPVRDIKLVPAAGSSIEALLSTLPGVNAPNELSASYTVRGGSFDENLVYINGVEIYRPQLISSGRKEGLSIINPDLVNSIYFSAGGFNSSYGEKLSSVLDIKYRKPESFAGSARAELMTNSVHLEGAGRDGRFTFLVGSRYMTNRILLRTLDTRADYTPAYFDLQTLLTMKTGTKSSLDLFISLARNKFEFVPVSGRSTFGSIANAYQLYVDYDGFERDSYLIHNSALSWNIDHSPQLKSTLMLQASASGEEESFDIRGRYLLNELDKNIGSENLGDSIMNIGIGTWLDHARNRIKTQVYIASFRSRWQNSRNILSWGTSLKRESIVDDLNEWRMIDSAGYSIPLSGDGLYVNKLIKAENDINSFRTEFYILDNYSFNAGSTNIIFTAGARLAYWSFNDEILFSPRVSVELVPNNSLSIYLAAGRYYQPPFYREMRYPDGSINTNVSSQSSLHFVFGTVWDFEVGYTPFRLSSEIYHKQLDMLIPYKFDNVRVVYAGENRALGKVSGLDLRLNGEFVRNADSWLSLSFMKAEHDIIDDNYGPYPAPADIRFSADLFFQDYFPSNPSYRAHIKIHFSTGIPVSSPYQDRYDNIYRMPPYRRVDIGFSKALKDEFSPLRAESMLNFFDRIIIGFEIFNLLDIKNTISYNWLSTINNLSGEVRQFAVPNYLTGRSLNLKLNFEF